MWGSERMMGSQRPITGQQRVPSQTGLGAVRIWLLDGFPLAVELAAAMAMVCRAREETACTARPLAATADSLRAARLR
jgi:hypothetical protein